MKYDYEKFPILEMIEKGRMNPKTLDKEGLILIEGSQDFFKKQVVPDIKIFNISESFYNAFYKSSDKLRGLMTDIEDGSYCFLLKNTTVIIKLYGDKEERLVYYQIYVRFKSDIVLMSVNTLIFSAKNECLATINGIRGYKSSQNNIKTLTGQPINEDPDNLIGMLFLLPLFIRYAKVETKILPPKSKTMGVGCYYSNSTKSKITMLDSKWFTTLVKSDAFKVRGHFRLQPKKVNGEWTKELIWINEFEKTGYTAPAKKLTVYGESKND